MAGGGGAGPPPPAAAARGCSLAFGCRSSVAARSTHLVETSTSGLRIDLLAARSSAAAPPMAAGHIAAAASLHRVAASRSGCGPARLRPPADLLFLSTFPSEIQSMSTFPAKTAAQIRFPRSRPAALLQNSILCRRFSPKPRHKIEFAGADLRFYRGNPFCVDVPPGSRFSVDVSRPNLGTKSSSLRHSCGFVNEVHSV